jgi:two-component system invasion response regulator UvrY
VSNVEPARSQTPPRHVGVLIVDDQQPFREVAGTLVGLLPGWHVVGAVDSGEDAVRAARQTNPDLILMDMNLPGISGMEATRQITAAQSGVLVVLVSTYAADDLPEDALSCGAAAYVRKEDLTPRALRALVSAS